MLYICFLLYIIVQVAHPVKQSQSAASIKSNVNTSVAKQRAVSVPLHLIGHRSTAERVLNLNQ